MLGTLCVAAGTLSARAIAGALPAQSVAASFDAIVDHAQLAQAGVVIFDDKTALYQRTTPGFDTVTPLPIASASKWIAAALIMTAVDRGELSLDDPVGRWIPEAPSPLRHATLRQLLSHTSGMAGRAIMTMGHVASLEDSVKKLMEEPMARAPGSGFAYGGASMQVAALMLERSAKQPYAVLMRERITGPLGMVTAKVGSPPSWGTGDVPWVAGGMAMSLDDYRRFLVMMLDKGEFEGKRILSPRAVSAIETNAIAGVPIIYKPRAADDTSGYGLGIWCENMAADGRCGLISSAGAFGTYPWLDRKHGRAGIFLTRSSLPKIFAGVVALRDAAEALPVDVAR